MDKEKLVELAKDVAEKRQAVVAAKELKLRSESLMQETTEGKAFQLYSEQLEQIGGSLVEAETTLKSAVVEVYKETEERKPITGTEVKIFKSLRYNADKVLVWCREKATGLLIVNKKAFEKTAVDMGAPVKVIEEPRCTLAKDLSSYLDSATEAEPTQVSEGGK